MRILFLIDTLGGGGAERATVNIAGRFAARGEDVTIATLHDGSNYFYDVPDSIRHIPLGSARRANGTLAAISNTFRNARHVRRLIRDERPDILIGVMTPSAILVALTRNRKAIVIGAEHGFPSALGGWRWPLLRRWTYGRLDAVTALTTEGSDWLAKNTPARDVHAIPNWISLPIPSQEPHVSVSRWISNDQRILLGVGRLHPVKAFHRLIIAFSNIAGKHSEWTLAIVGEGSERAYLEKMIEDLGLEGRVILPGRVGNIADWYSAADVLALTSLSESFGNVLTEALAHGCPVISVDCDAGPRNIIKHEENGLLVPQDDPEALVAGLDRLMSDEALRKRLAARGPEVLETFSPDRVFAMWEELFDALMQKKSGKRRWKWLGTK